MTVRVERIEWDDPRGVALRAAMDAETGERSAHVGRSATAAEQAARARWALYFARSVRRRGLPLLIRRCAPSCLQRTAPTASA